MNYLKKYSLKLFKNHYLLRGVRLVNLYPINLNLENRNVLIVGGGKVALRKLKQVFLTTAKIKIVSPEFNPAFEEYFNLKSEKLLFKKRKFKAEDLTAQFLVLVATDNTKLNREIAFLAHQNNILANIADNAQISDFTVPAVVKRGELLLTVSSGGNLPALSKNIKEKLERKFGIEYQLLLEFLSKKRPQIIKEVKRISLRKRIFRKLASDQFLIEVRKMLKELDLKLAKNPKTEFELINIADLNQKQLKLIYQKLELKIDKIIKKLRDD